MIVLDTDVVIDFLRGKASTVDRVRRALDEGETLGITAVNVGEILRGIEGSKSADRKTAFEDLLEKLEVLPVNFQAARRYGRVLTTLDEAGWPIPGMDGLIAAVTLENGGRLFTGNVRHFDRIGGLEIVEATDGGC